MGVSQERNLVIAHHGSGRVLGLSWPFERFRRLNQASRISGNSGSIKELLPLRFQWSIVRRRSYYDYTSKKMLALGLICLLMRLIAY